MVTLRMPHISVAGLEEAFAGQPVATDTGKSGPDGVNPGDTLGDTPGITPGATARNERGTPGGTGELAKGVGG